MSESEEKPEGENAEEKPVNVENNGGDVTINQGVEPDGDGEDAKE